MTAETEEPTAAPTLLQPGSAAPTAVTRYWHPGDKDWLSVPAHGNQPTAAQLQAYGYQHSPATQFRVSLVGNGEMVANYRWWHPVDKDWVDVPAGSIPDATMTASGYRDKTFQYYAFPTQRAGTVAVYRWWHPSDKDWITIRDGEISDTQMQAYGYQSKTLLFYAFPAQSSTESGYTTLGTPQKSVLSPTSWSGPDDHPHTLSVLDVNPQLSPSINNGFRYVGYYGHHECSGLGIARSNDLDAAAWTQEATPLFTGGGERWPCAVRNANGTIGLVHNVYWCGGNPDGGAYYIVGRTSTDGLNGKTFTSVVPLVKEASVNNGNPTLFRDPDTQRVYLYWFREAPGRREIRVKSAATFADLLNTNPADMGDLVACCPDVVAAPDVVKIGSVYYLAVETYEQNGVWMTRVLTSTNPTGSFYEIPGGPVYGPGSACVFQHVFEGKLHSYYCNEATGHWTLDHVSSPLL